MYSVLQFNEKFVLCRFCSVSHWAHPLPSRAIAAHQRRFSAASSSVPTCIRRFYVHDYMYELRHRAGARVVLAQNKSC